MSSHEEEYLARIEQITVGLQRDAERSGRELAQSQEQRAEAARGGELGKDWQAIQRRIDAGQTSLSAVFAGEDDSPEALRLLGLSRATISRMADELPPELQEEIVEVDAEYAGLGRSGIAPPPPPPLPLPPTDLGPRR